MRDRQTAEGPEERQLARRIVEGDAAALECFYARYADPLFAFIYHHVEPQRADAEELWQDTLWVALRSLATFRGGAGGLFGWLCGIARHKVADYYRRRTHEAELFSDLPEGVVESFFSPTPLPEEIVQNRAVRIRVAEALGQLSEEYRTALVARYVESCEVEEVGRRLGRGYKATESLLSRAREAFRAALGRLER